MSDKSNIEWTDATWNPVRGCSLISDGCTHCYAMKQAHRFSGPGKAYEGLTELGPDGPRWNGKITLVESELDKPLRWKRPRKIFINSMSDLFHEAVSFEFIDQVLAIAALCPQHIFIVLTKRPERMAEYFQVSPGFRNMRAQWSMNGVPFPLPNLWLGVSVEDQKTADDRIPPLLECPAAVRFVSYEPALGPVDFREIAEGGWPNLDWVICGGESGPGARPMHPDWARKVRDDCQAADVPFFFKQWGKWAPHPHPAVKGKDTGAGIFMRPDGTWGNQGEFWDGDAQAMDKHKNKNDAGALLDFTKHHQFPEVSHL